MNQGPDQIPTKQIGELLEMVSTKVPKLMSEMLAILYSEEAGTRLGKSIGIFYKELVNAGIPPEEAMAMTRDYMNYVKDLAADMVPKNMKTHLSGHDYSPS